METWDAIRSRKNVRNYLDQPIPDEALGRILESGRRSPSARNTQPWDFVVTTDRDQLRALSECWRGAGHVARSAATVAIVAPRAEDERSDRMIQYDLGQLTMTMMLVAADLGIGSAHAAVEDQDLARRTLGFPDDRRLAWLIAFGYPADGPLELIANLNRRPFDEIVHRGRW
jgi:nitroreductase